MSRPADLEELHWLLWSMAYRIAGSDAESPARASGGAPPAGPAEEPTFPV